MGEPKGKLSLLLGAVNQALAWIAGAIIVFMMFAISYSVLMRYLWDKPVPWVVEVSSYLMLYITFLATGWLLYQDGHVEVDLVVGNMKPRTRAGFKAITFIGGALVGFILTWKGMMVTVDYLRRGVTVMGILNTPQFLLIAIIPVGGLLLLFGFILKIFNFAKLAFKGETAS